MAHTPGPWFAYGRYIGTKNHKSLIGECRDENGNWSDTVMASSNASLIAAAPDLLEVVKAFEAFYPTGINPYLDDAAIKARAAIAKAEAPAMTRFFAGWTLTALLGSCLLYGALTTLDGRIKVEDLRGQEAFVAEPRGIEYREASR